MTTSPCEITFQWKWQFQLFQMQKNKNASCHKGELFDHNVDIYHHVGHYNVEDS